jgi:hypothetical protein
MKSNVVGGLIVVALIAAAIGYIGGASVPRTTTTIEANGTTETLTGMIQARYFVVVACTTSAGVTTTTTDYLGGTIGLSVEVSPNLPSDFVATVTTAQTSTTTFTQYATSEC